MRLAVDSLSLFPLVIAEAFNTLKYSGEEVDAGSWQGISTAGKPDLVTLEVMDLRFAVNLWRPSWEDSFHDWMNAMADEIEPNLPWANEHFAERVGGKAMNPDPSYEHWPWWQGQEGTTMYHGKFTHTYSERFWPMQSSTDGYFTGNSPRGVRYHFGNYDDVLTLLSNSPYTRQAYLPIFFPEDTGAVHGGRIPCSLGYHFLLRDGELHCWYDIRSCDAVRHFRDDLYLAAILVGWTIDQLMEMELRSTKNQVWVDVKPGQLFFSCHSFHVHKGDLHHVEAK